MKDRTLTIETLKKYCRENGIPFNDTAKREELEAFIARSFLHDRPVKLDEDIGCFGYWSDDDTNCLLCSFKSDCQKVSLGMDKSRYDRLIKRLDNPKFSVAVKARKQKKKLWKKAGLLSKEKILDGG